MKQRLIKASLPHESDAERLCVILKNIGYEGEVDTRIMQTPGNYNSSGVLRFTGPFATLTFMADEEQLAYLKLTVPDTITFTYANIEVV